TPRALTWSGGLIVLGVALFLLPLLPTLAQSPPPGRPSPEEELRRAEAAAQQAAANLEQARAQVNQARQQANRMAGDHQPNQDVTQRLVTGNETCLRCHADAHAVPNPKAKDQVGEAHSAVIRLAAEVQKQQAALHETENKLHDAMRKLEEQTRPAGERRLPEVGRPGRGPG